MSVTEPESTTPAPVPTSTVPTSTVLAVDVANRFAHLYLDVADLLGTHESGDHDATRGLEFFDLDGCRLAPAFDGNWTLVGLVKINTAVPTNELQTRLLAVFAFLADYARNHQDELSDDYGITLDEALATLPDLTGLTLVQSIALLGGVTHAAPPAGTEADPGSWFHNLMHKLS
jgi:hypothetical protein